MLLKNLGVDSGNANKMVDVCDVCLRAKQTRNQFNVSERNVSDLFEIIHCDIWGFYNISSFCGPHYFLIIIDDVSRVVWKGELMKEKGGLMSIL